ncbi:MAG TPA: lipid-binding SYLF domain-containing protein [Candidatus Acidoferrales bacterium]|nr:lipid-binding SYLF domain-containing protein [Candidatus Acidoferrales bacterium]
MKRALAVIVVMFLSAPFLTLRADEGRTERRRVEKAGRVMREILNVPDDIPQNLLNHARCVVVMPSVVKGAFIFGGAYGRGVMVCRSGENYTGPWGAPTMMALEGASFGFQIGGEATDYVFLVMNDSGARSLLHSKVKLGADASVAAGPVGRTTAADTDVFLHTELLTYSRARGIFAGVSIEGSTLRPDGFANHNLYGRDLTPEQIALEGEVPPPAAADPLIQRLDTSSPKLG